MRDIKFRVWNKTDKSFLDGTITPYNCICNVLSENSLIFQQYTGQDDIDDKEIYDGDLVSLHYANQPDIPESLGLYEVFWKRSGFYLKQHKHNWFSTSFGDPKRNINLLEDVPPYVIVDQLPLTDFNICRVEGNILENKDLLK
jgi:hypothetical protein